MEINRQRGGAFPGPGLNRIDPSTPHPIPLPQGERGRCGKSLRNTLSIYSEKNLPLPLRERAGVRGHGLADGT
jgi:hypothetical protein